jgi:hypothetical protein
MAAQKRRLKASSKADATLLSGTCNACWRNWAFDWTGSAAATTFTSIQKCPAR